MAEPPLQVKSADELLAVLREESAKRRQSNQVLAWTLGGGLVLLFVLYLAVFLIKGRLPDDPLTSFGPMLVFFGAAAGVTTRHRKALELAASEGDPRLAGYLLEALHVPEAGVRGIAVAPLTKMLAALRPEDAEEFLPHHRALLLRTLDRRQPPDLVRAALLATRAVCGSEAVPAIERLIQSGQDNGGAPWLDLALATVGEIRFERAREIIQASSTEREDVRA
jgi:hypothetical protein